MVDFRTWPPPPAHGLVAMVEQSWVYQGGAESCQFEGELGRDVGPGCLALGLLGRCPQPEPPSPPTLPPECPPGYVSVCLSCTPHQTTTVAAVNLVREKRSKCIQVSCELSFHHGTQDSTHRHPYLYTRLCACLGCIYQ